MAFALPVAGDCCSPCSSCAVTIAVSGSGGGAILVVKSLAEARVITSPAAAASLFLDINGNMTGGDFFLGIFTWDPLSTAVDDSAGVLIPNDNPITGRWIRQV